MTFATIVTEVAARLDLSSSEATTRIGRELNVHYRDLTASLGLNPTRRSLVTANTTIASNDVTYAAIEKIERIINQNTIPYKILQEVTYDDIRNLNPESNSSDSPTCWAVKSVTSSGIVIALDKNAVTQYALKAEGLVTNSDLSGSNEPAFPQSFHYILTEFCLYDEYMRMEKKDLAQLSLGRAERGLSDLRMFFAKSAYLDIVQNGRKVRNTALLRNLDWNL